MARYVGFALGLVLLSSARVSSGEPAPAPEVSASPGYLRLDLGINAPEGYASLTGGKMIRRIHAVEATLGRGAAATFLGASYRISLSGPAVWQLAAEVGGSIGVPNGQGYDEDQDPENPNTQTSWIHGEIGVQRVVTGVVFAAAIGIETLVHGRYHVDAVEVNVVDRTAGSVQPYVQVGAGVGF